MSYDEITAQTIRALAAIDDALGLPQDGCNSTEQTLTAIQKLREALALIEAWKPPRIECRGELVPMAVAIGSNGERDYFRGIARAALAQEQGESN